MLCLGMTVLPVVGLKAEPTKGSSTAAISSKAPSEEYINSAEGYIMRERTSLAVNETFDAFNAPMTMFRASNMWQDPTMPESGWSNPGNVGAPIADSTLPIVLSIFVLYLIYRGTTTSRKRNNF